HLEAALAIDKQSVAAKRMLAIVHAALGNLPAAEALLAAASASGVADAEDVRLNVVLLSNEGSQASIRRAVSLMEDIVARDTVQPTDRLLMAQLYERQAKITDNPAAIQERRSLAEKQLTLLAAVPQADPSHLATLVQFLVRSGQKEPAAKWVAALEKRIDE